MFEPYQPTRVPVKVYRASDVGAPQIKIEAGNLKTLFKACLVTGYGEGDNRKEPLGWQMFDETANSVVFHSSDPKSHGHGLKVDNANTSYIQAYMVGGERFQTYMGYGTQGYNNFAYNSPSGKNNWLLVGHSRAFIFVLPQDTKNSQILFFGDVAGMFADTGNTLYLNTSYASTTNWDTGTLNNNNHTPPLIVRSQWKNGGTEPLSSVVGKIYSLFLDDAIAYPDALYGNCALSAIFIAEMNGAMRVAVPCLFSSYHNLQTLNELTDVPIANSLQRHVKLNLHDTANPIGCFALNIQEWEV